MFKYCIRSILLIVFFAFPLFLKADDCFKNYAPSVLSYTVPADTAKNAGLLKKLAEALKFRKNAMTKEEKRIISIIDGVLKDSSVTTVHDLGKLKKDLTDSAKAQFDSLLKLIQSIKTEKPEAKGIGPTNSNTIEQEPITDPNTQYINALIDKIVPILKDNKEEEQKRADKQKKLKLLRSIYNKPATFLDTINDSTAIKYRLKIKQKAEVWGIFDNSSKSTNFDHKVLSTLAYYPYLLDGKTGYSKNFTGWNDAAIIDNAQQAGNKIILAVLNEDPLNIAAFLTNEEAQKNLINSTLNLLAARNADGINITFRGLNRKLSGYFLNFITDLNKAYKAGPKQFSISITLPRFDSSLAYNINALDPLTDNFLIDFSVRATTKHGPLAPLHQDSDYSIESCVSRYLNSNVPPYKFILLLPYNGTLWKTNTKTGISSFVRYISYSEIRAKYQYSDVEFDKETATSKIELKDGNGKTNATIWYDDESSLDKKYDFILANGLGGAALYPLGADDGYGELWDELSSKFLKVDTIKSDTVNLRSTTRLTGWKYIKSTLGVYYHVLEHPCSIDVVDDRLIKYFNIFLVVLTLAVAIVLIYHVKSYGDAWRWKKTAIGALIVLVNLLVITIFMWLFLADQIPWFGAGANCINMPFSVLLLIVFSGILIGTLVMRFLIFPAIKKDDKP